METGYYWIKDIINNEDIWVIAFYKDRYFSISGMPYTFLAHELSEIGDRVDVPEKYKNKVGF